MKFLLFRQLSWPFPLDLLAATIREVSPRALDYRLLDDHAPSVRRSSTNCCMIVQRPLEDEGERKNWLTDTGEKRKR